MPDQTSLDERLFERVARIVAAARAQGARTVNTAMVHAYWHIGREIVEVQQGGAPRAAYGDALVRRLAQRLTKRYGKGFSYPTVKRMRQFYLTFPRGSALHESGDGLSRVEDGRAAALRESGSTALTLSGKGEKGSKALSLFPPLLGWSHYLALLKVKDDRARRFYEIEAARESWSVRQLSRQIASLLFERLTLQKGEDEIQELASRGQEVVVPSDVLKDPFVLEFLDLRERPSALERDLEQAIIDRLEDFLLEMGKGFCFVARQRRITLEGDHFYIDLVFYNRLLRCFVLIDLKLGKLSHQDLGQMQMYVNFYDRLQREEHEERTVGIVLCSDKNDAMVRITLPEDNAHIVAARYQMVLPTEEELRAELLREREEAERVLHLAPPSAADPGDQDRS